MKLHIGTLGIRASDGFFFSNFSAITNGIIIAVTLALARDLACGIFLYTTYPKFLVGCKFSKMWSIVVAVIPTGCNQDILFHKKITGTQVTVHQLSYVEVLLGLTIVLMISLQP